MGPLSVYESWAFMKGQFKMSVICFGLNGVLWQGCMFKIIPVHWHFWFEFVERLRKVSL